MRIAYVIVHLGADLLNGGVGNKIKTQMHLWRDLGNEARIFLLTPDETVLFEGEKYLFKASSPVPVMKFLSRELSRSRQLMHLLKDVQTFKPDLIYLRYGLYTYPLHRLAEVAPLIVELNSNDVDENRHRGWFFYGLNRLTRGMLLKHVAGWVAVSHEIAVLPFNQRFRKPGCVISNGVDFQTVEPLPAPRHIRPEVTLAGSPAMNWHGVDKLIHFAGMNPDITVNIIGYGRDAVEGTIPSNVHMHGMLSRSGTREILAQSDVVCGTLALHRKNMQEASPLKVREALAYGLPVILAYTDTDLNGLDLDVILQLPNQEDNLIKAQAQVRDFIYRMMGKRVERNTIMHLVDQRKKETERLSFFQQILDAQRLAA